MPAAEFEMTAEDLRKRVLQLRHFIDQGEFSPGEMSDEDEEEIRSELNKRGGTDADADAEVDHQQTLLGQVFTREELDYIGEQDDRLYAALRRIEEDYAKVVNAGDDLERSQDAVDAMVALAILDADGGADDDTDEDQDDERNDDPDADLEEEQ